MQKCSHAGALLLRGLASSLIRGSGDLRAVAESF